MQIKDLELSRELSAEEQGAVEGGFRNRTAAGTQLGEIISTQSLSIKSNVGNGSTFNNLGAVVINADVVVDQTSDNDLDQHQNNNA